MKTALITGVGRGIGKALADKFLAEGYLVIGTTLTSDHPVQQEHLQVHTLDLSSGDSIARFVSSLQTSGSKIDILINNSGVLHDEEETSLVPDKLRSTLEVNMIGTADLTERLIPLMNKSGHVLFISSAAGSITEASDTNNSHFPYHYPAYKISKAALNMYARTLAVRLAHENYGITVSSVHPGWVRTDMGGDEAPVSPLEASEDIYKLAVSTPATGQFWFKGKQYAW